MTDLLDDAVAAAGLTVFGVATTTRPADAPAPFPFLPGPELTSRIVSLRADLRAHGLDRVVVCGPGAGAPAIAATLGLDLTVLRNGDPHQLHTALTDVGRTVVVLAAAEASVVTDAYRRALLQAFEDAGIHDAGRRFVVVTAPDSVYETFALELGAQLFLAAPTSSALSAYALVPAGLAGADTAALLAEASALQAPPAPAQRQPAGFGAPIASAPTASPDIADISVLPGVALGETIAAAVRQGRDKLAIASDGTGIDGLGPWIEQLFGAALVTVALENPSSWGHEGPDVLGVTVGGVLGRAIMPGGGIRPDLSVNGPLGAHLLTWEQAAMVAGGVAPPPAAEGDDLLRRLDGEPPAEAPALVEGAIEVYGDTAATTLIGAIDELARAVAPGGRIAIAAHLDPAGDARVAEARDALAGRIDRAVTFGWGARAGATLIITGAVTHDVRVPGKSYTFGELQAASARTAEGPVLRLHLTDRATGTEELLAALGG
ncbi:glucose-6-phosphate isomerase [Dactylosporangium sp. NPDC051541]|uniref:glucose-6-phosphate isomerase n=1 Tax=Dactylosporangium sp. NPDC051541 TaxID=3363977 RepID=UPI0037B3AD13